MVQGTISFHYVDVKFTFKNRNALKTFLLKLFRQEGKGVGVINYIFCTDAYLLELNIGYLQHDTLTDIITFPLSESAVPLIADVFISVERVRENAQIFSTSFNHELHRVIFHGALHLCGYKDKSKTAQGFMRSKEDFYLEKYLFHVK